MLESSVPPADLGAVSVFRAAMQKHAQEVGADRRYFLAQVIWNQVISLQHSSFEGSRS